MVRLGEYFVYLSVSVGRLLDIGCRITSPSAVISIAAPFLLVSADLSTCMMLVRFDMWFVLWNVAPESMAQMSCVCVLLCSQNNCGFCGCMSVSSSCV